MSAALSIRGVARRYPNGVLALGGIDLEVPPDGITAILGGSGCGKSTLLRLIAGLDRPSAGRVLLDGQEVTGPRAEIGIVFQEPRLMPWLTIADNIAFGIRHLPREERRERTARVLQRVGLGGHEQRWPRELSGGQAQRVALARALVGRPRVLLLDEPFSALDAFLRADLQDHLLQLWAEARMTLVIVTHDVEEALVLADRICVLRPNPGRVADIVTPGLPRPRQRLGPAFLDWRRRTLAALQSSLDPAVAPGEESAPAAAI